MTSVDLVIYTTAGSDDSFKWIKPTRPSMVRSAEMPLVFAASHPVAQRSEIWSGGGTDLPVESI